MNRKILYTVFLVFFCPFLAFAQIKDFGVKLGVTSAKQSWDYPNFITSGFRWGLDVGGFVESDRFGFISIVGESHYIQKGTKLTVNGTVMANNAIGYIDTVLIHKPRLDYISVAILAKYQIDDFIVKPYVLAGPRIDFVIGKYEDGYKRIYDDFKNIDNGATFGLGFETSIVMETDVMIEVRYSPSFTVGFKNSSFTVKNKSLEILFGVQL
jgi:hypothetical protein